MRNDSLHKPVMVKEVCETLNVEKLAHLHEARIIDATIGLGGHSIEFIKRGINVLGIDSDINSLKIAEKNLSEARPLSHTNQVGKPFTLIQGSFKDLKRIGAENNFISVDGILFDLGISSYQLDDEKRGFSFKNRESPLDLRIDKDNFGVTGADLLNALNVHQLFDLFREVMDFGNAKKLSKAVVINRKKRKVETVGDFVDLIKNTIYSKESHDKSTLPFLALRIAVNSELQNLREVLPQTLEILKGGGRCIVISFHSGEDKIVKDFFRQFENEKLVRILKNKPILPEASEIKLNQKARSAKLRFFEKV